MSESGVAKTIVPGRAEGVVRVPGSKSLTLRALACASLARGRSRISNALLSSDSRRLADAFRRLGARVDEDEARRAFDVVGTAGPPRVGGAATRGALPDARLDVADCGTCMRLLVAIAAGGHGTVDLDGTARMRERPVGGLVDALRAAGVEVEWLGAPGRPPLRVRGVGLGAAEIEVDASESSQYLSAIVLAASAANGPVRIRSRGALRSRPYVDLTVDCLRAFGGEVDVVDAVEEGGAPTFLVRPRVLEGRDYEVEGDYSSASYFFAAAAVTCGAVEVPGLREDSRQGDRRFLDFLRALGHRSESTASGVRVLGRHGDREGREVTFDFGDCPDVVPTAAVVAALGPDRVTITGAPHLRIKESDRIATVCGELARLGADAEERDDGLVVRGGRPLHGAAVETHDDHRIAMAFAVAGLRIPGVRILDPGCTAKSYPDFFRDLESVVTPLGA